MLQKTPTGISGLDEITEGGLPTGRVSLVVGEPGAGKTILGLEFLVRGATEFGEPGLLVSFEERAEEIIVNASGFGWALQAWPPEEAVEPSPEKVHVIDAQLPLDTVAGGDFDLSGLLATVSAVVRKTGARRVVFDGLNVLLDLLEGPSQRRREIARLGEWTRGAGVTTVITAQRELTEFAGADAGYSFLPYIVSCIIGLRTRSANTSSERLIRVLKLRGSNHSGSDHPLIIRSAGIIIGDIGSHRLAYEARMEHVSSGVPRLDGLLGGGYFKASGVLISGAPGTAKSTLSGAFIEAACARGERALLISFDEAFAQIERNLRSVNIHLQPHVDAGLLATAGYRTGRLTGEDHFHQIMELIEAHQPSAMVIDPISALEKVVGEGLAGDLAERLIDEAKVRGITILLTSLLDGPEADLESTRVQISSIADTWIQLSFSVLNGERNRALTIIKSRGNAHSNQVRELVLSDQGLALADVYAQGGAVLMGTARIERELADAAQEERAAREGYLAQLELDEREASLRARLDELTAELKKLDVRRTATNAEIETRTNAHTAMRRRLLLSRNADPMSDAEADD